MKNKALLAVYSLLFLCIAMYVGTGGSMVLFSFPVAAKLTVANYYWVFVPEVEAATRFFTVMTTVMIVAALIMLAAEWRSRFRWVPLVVLASIFIATGLTLTLIFPLNHAMAAGITNPAELHAVLTRWMGLNKWRVFLWLIQWLAMMWYFVSRRRPSRLRGGEIEAEEWGPSQVPFRRQGETPACCPTRPIPTRPKGSRP